MKIEIWSDIACPYCYIGKRKLEQALALHPHKEEIELVWNSYELNPSLPKHAIGRSYYNCFAEQMKVSEDAARELMKPLIMEAKEVGLNFDFENLVVTNTSDALRLIKLANKYDKANEAEELLFEAYFIDGKCVSDRAFLVTTGQQLGIHKDELEQMLDSDLFVDQIAKDMNYSEQTLNLEYIPFYWFNKKTIIQGAIEPSLYLNTLLECFNDWKVNGVSTQKGDIINGQSCSIDGVCG